MLYSDYRCLCLGNLVGFDLCELCGSWWLFVFLFGLFCTVFVWYLDYDALVHLDVWIMMLMFCETRIPLDLFFFLERDKRDNRDTRDTRDKGRV